MPAVPVCSGWGSLRKSGTDREHLGTRIIRAHCANLALQSYTNVSTLLECS